MVYQRKDESTLVTDSSAPFMHHDQNDLGSGVNLILACRTGGHYRGRKRNAIHECGARERFALVYHAPPGGGGLPYKMDGDARRKF